MQWEGGQEGPETSQGRLQGNSGGPKEWGLGIGQHEGSDV